MRWPDVAPRRGLGVGFDLPHGARLGFQHDAATGADVLAPGIERFLAARAPALSGVFFSIQPRTRAQLRLGDYLPAWDDLVARAPRPALRTLHHTMLNLGALEPYDRRAPIDLANALIRRHGFAWVNEDLGLWSLGGRPLPYPMPPLLTDEGLEAAVRNVAEVQAALAAPLVVEFPGFAPGTSLAIGPWHPYDFLATLSRRTGSPVTLDVGHLLSYQWSRGRRGADLHAELARLPLEAAVELHVAGATIADGRFEDRHHGVLCDEQLELVRRLLDVCPALRLVTFEDPRPDDDGGLTPESEASFAALAALVSGWAASA